MDLVHHTKAIVRAHGKQQGQGIGGLLRCRLPRDLGGTLEWDRMAVRVAVKASVAVKVGLEWDKSGTRVGLE